MADSLRYNRRFDRQARITSLFKPRLSLFALALFLFCSGALAQLSIEITGGGGNRIPIAVLPFTGEGAVPPGISGIVTRGIQSPSTVL